MSYTAYHTTYVAIEVSGKPLPDFYMQRWQSLEFVEDMGDPGSQSAMSSAVTITFSDNDFALMDNKDLKVGATITVYGGYNDDHGKLFEGKITGLGLECSENGDVVTRLSAMDNTVLFTINEEPACFKNMDDNEVITEIARKLKLDVEIKDLASQHLIKRELVTIPAGKKQNSVLNLLKRNGNIMYCDGNKLVIQKWGDIKDTYLLDYKMGLFNLYSFSNELLFDVNGNKGTNVIPTTDPKTGKPDAKTAENPDTMNIDNSGNMGLTHNPLPGKTEVNPLDPTGIPKTPDPNTLPK